MVFGECMGIVCKFCEGVETIKSGRMKGHQRYRCKCCGRHFTDTPQRKCFDEQQKLLALSLYASGLSMNRIAKFFGVSCVAVMKWIRILSEKLCDKPKPSCDRVLVLEVDEFWHYLKKSLVSFGSLKPMIVIVSDLSIGNVEIVLPKPLNASTIA